VIAVVQRVVAADVVVGGDVIGRIGPGLVALVAVHRNDTSDDISWTANKLLALRLFPSGDKDFDISVAEAGGSILLVGNFTVAARTAKGRRPSFDDAADAQAGLPLFDDLVRRVASSGVPVQTGRFGAHMHVSIVNDGPVTVIINSRAAMLI
jgi:D-tyrosyl-tRNA(Tyr) deacylase